MKKSLLIVAVAFAAFTFSSCVKTRDCVCTDSSGASTTTPIKGTKSESKTACAALASGGETCTLK